VAIANAGCFEQRLELRGVEKADVAIDAVRLRLLGEPPRVLVRPTLADREVEDPVQESKVVVRALDRMLGKALFDEILDVVDRDLGYRRLAEVRRSLMNVLWIRS
jgi:hypothetical protein